MAQQAKDTLKKNVLSAQIDLSKFHFDASSFEKASEEEKKTTGCHERIHHIF